MYFRIPEVCRLLTKASRVEFHNAVDRTTPGKRIIEFVDAFDGLYIDMLKVPVLALPQIATLASLGRQASDLDCSSLLNVVSSVPFNTHRHIDMLNQHWLRSFALWQAIKRERPFPWWQEEGGEKSRKAGSWAVFQVTDYMTLVMAVAVNLAVLLRGYLVGETDGESGQVDADSNRDFNTSETVMGALMVVSTSITFVYQFVEVSGVRVNRAALASNIQRNSRWYWLYTPKWLLQDFQLVWCGLLLGCAVAGVAFHPVFFSLHLFDFALKFKDLRKAGLRCPTSNLPPHCSPPLLAPRLLVCSPRAPLHPLHHLYTVRTLHAHAGL